jgi:mannose-6-phosphate isomerase-like protein (cupin superfamily)
METINLKEKFSRFSDYTNPRVIGEINDIQVKAVKLKGEFIWHHHELEDELFLVVKGTLRMKFRDHKPSFTKASSSSSLRASSTVPLPTRKSTSS